jgi:hypothetical protein
MAEMVAQRQFELLKVHSWPIEQSKEGWVLEAEHGADFLKENAQSEYVALYASMPACYICSILAPAEALATPDIDDLLSAAFTAEESWAIQKSVTGDVYDVYLEPPLTHPGSKSLSGSEPMIFRRSFHGMNDFDPGIEVNQKLIHALGLFLIPERNAYCRLTEDGDLQDVISLFHEKKPNPFEEVRAVFVLAEALSEYLAISAAVLYRRFDFTRSLPGFGGWGSIKRSEYRAGDLFFRKGLSPGSGSFISGGQVVRPLITRERLVETWRRSFNDEEREYETFLIQDWKNKRLVKVSSPSDLSNYFQQSDKPFEVSPVFFRPDVLYKYKADSDKYTISNRSITCRNAWHLKTYDINEAGQVHTYIVYIYQLPIREQRYWKSFNEPPRSAISKRAFENDFLGEWSSEEQPLEALRGAIAELDEWNPKWWKRRGSDLSECLIGPVTDSAKEWADELLTLDQLVVEGFTARELRAVAEVMGLKPEREWQSLKLIEVLLCAVGYANEEATEVVGPLRELHHLRSKVRGHSAREEARELQRAAIRHHGGLRNHFFSLCKQCGASLTEIAQALRGLNP